MLVIDTRIKLLLFILINFMVFGLKDFILGSVCFFFICILSCLMGQKKIVLKYLVFYVVIAAIQQLCIYLPQAIETILSIFTLFIRVMIPVVLFASTFIATTKVSELIAAMYSLKIPRSITITFAIISSGPIIMNRDAVVYAHVGLFKQDVQLAVQNQTGISKRVVVDQIIQL